PTRWLLQALRFARASIHFSCGDLLIRMATRMRAVLLDQHGPADNLRYVTDYPVPEPGDGEVRVRVRAAALNRLDIWVRNGWPGIKLELPHILGADAAGDVDKVGPGVTGWNPGDRAVIDPSVSCGRC